MPQNVSSSIANLKENKMHTQWNLWSNFSICISSHWINIPKHDGRVVEHQHEMVIEGHWRGEGVESYSIKSFLICKCVFFCVSHETPISLLPSMKIWIFLVSEQMICYFKLLENTPYRKSKVSHKVSSTVVCIQ